MREGKIECPTTARAATGGLAEPQYNRAAIDAINAAKMPGESVGAAVERDPGSWWTLGVRIGGSDVGARTAIPDDAATAELIAATARYLLGVAREQARRGAEIRARRFSPSRPSDRSDERGG